jgi:SAM-dependent methyltransferase
MAGQDISPSGVAQTQAACAERGIPFDGRVSDMRSIPWPNATFDGAFSTATIHHGLRAEIERSLAELRRVLKPGGALLIDLLDANRPEYHELRARADAGQVREVEPHTFIDESNADDPDGFLPHHYSDEADARGLLNSFEILRLWSTQNPPGEPVNPRARWVAMARKPLSD